MAKTKAKPKSKTVWRKSPPALIAAFDRALPTNRDVERRKMFGYPAVFARGKMASGLWQEFVIVRLPEDQRAEIAARHGARPFEPSPGRRMKEYVVLPDDIVADAPLFSSWIARAVDYASSLGGAPKKAKPRPPEGGARPRRRNR
jgi:TfoX/Sxy family transcriptional regulator of competence genes